MVKSPGPSPYMRKPMKEEEYNIYGVLYTDKLDDRASVVISAKSEKEAVSILEEAVRGVGHMNSNLNPDITDTGFKTSKKGLIFGYDQFSNTLL